MRALPRLADVLPPGLDAAEAVLDRVFARAAMAPDTPPEAAAMHRWLRTLLRAEYAAGPARRIPPGTIPHVPEGRRE